MLSERCRYILFWLWEYTRRNEDNSSTFAEFAAAKLPPPPTQKDYVGPDGFQPIGWMDLITFDFKGWGTVTRSDQYYSTADRMIKAIIAGNFQYRFPNPTRRWEGLQEKNADDGLFFIDFSKPLAELQACLEYEYFFQTNSDKELSALDFGLLQSIEENILTAQTESQTSLQRIHLNNVERSVGLWLYDHKLSSAGSTQSAITAFKKTYLYEFPEKPDGFDDGDLRMYYRATKACIGGKKVMAMNDKGK